MMKVRFGWGVLMAGLALVLALLATDYVPPVWGQAEGDRVDRGAGNLTVVHLPASGGGQWVVLIDNATRAMGTYLIDGQSGGISLKSVRNCAWDLYLEEFNGSTPAPRDIKTMLENR